MLLTLIKFAGMKRETKSFQHSCARVFVLVSDINFMKIVHSAIINAWAIRKQKISGM